MKIKPMSKSAEPPKTVLRGKYAAAFKEGVNVVIGTKAGKRRFKVRRQADGSMIWKPTP